MELALHSNPFHDPPLLTKKERKMKKNRSVRSFWEPTLSVAFDIWLPSHLRPPDQSVVEVGGVSIRQLNLSQRFAVLVTFIFIPRPQSWFYLSSTLHKGNTTQCFLWKNSSKDNSQWYFALNCAYNDVLEIFQTTLTFLFSLISVQSFVGVNKSRNKVFTGRTISLYFFGSLQFECSCQIIKANKFKTSSLHSFIVSYVLFWPHRSLTHLWWQIAINT